MIIPLCRSSKWTMNLNGQVNSNPFVVSVEEAGRLLGIKQTKVYDLMRTRELAFVKIGRSTRIELAAIQAYIDRQRIGSKPRIIR
jgi:excisionase family DNA binding protein